MNIKKITAIAAAVIMAAGICTGVPTSTESIPSLAVTAEAASDSDFIIKTNDNGDKYLAEYKGKGGNVVIPQEVALIDSEVFAGNDKITSVTFKGKYVWVNPYSFAECRNLKKVVFDGDATIGNNAFEWSCGLESVTVKGSIRKGIYSNAFYGCESLKTVKISKNSSSFVIGGGAFRDCYSLTSINIPSKCTEIFGCAFLNCFSLSKLTIPADTKINTEDNANGHFGYAFLYPTLDDLLNAVEGGASDTSELFVADGKTSGYVLYYNVKDKDIEKSAGKNSMGSYNSDIALYYDKSYELINYRKYTPKQLTLTVTKGSSAEKWAKANKIKYTYASSKNAPSNLKASAASDSVTLTWDKAEDAAMYRVYRYNNKTKKFEKYKDVKTEKCTVKGLKANTKYKFKVVSYSKSNGKYVKGESSEAVSVTTKK